MRREIVPTKDGLVVRDRERADRAWELEQRERDPTKHKLLIAGVVLTATSIALAALKIFVG